MFLSGIGRNRVLLGALALVTSCLWLGVASAKADYCASQMVRDYTKVLKQLPAIPPPPLDEHPDFAPAQVYLWGQGRGPLQVGPATRGFDLFLSTRAEDNSVSRRVDWQVISRLVMLDRRGHRIGSPRIIERYVPRVHESTIHFTFKVPGTPAIYRQEIVFKDRRGKRLARYGDYFRTLRPSLDVDFELNGSTFHRGELVRAWLVNRGVAVLSFGLSKAIQFNDGTAWVSPPVPFPGGPVPAIGLAIGPGVKTSCWSTTIPIDAAPGIYRLATEVSHSTWAPFSGSDPLDLAAEFTVTE